jgi:oligoribonuclease
MVVVMPGSIEKIKGKKRGHSPHFKTMLLTMKQKLLWCDMEMTGLKVEKEVIIEVACIVTNLQLEPLDQYEAVVYQPRDFLDRMDEWNTSHHTQSGLINKVQFGKPQALVEKELIAFVREYFDIPKERPILAGNSIAQDRSFINLHMPELAKTLHYRMLDVSSWKIIFENVYNQKYEKQKNHRALDDITESIEELKFYMQSIRRSE